MLTLLEGLTIQLNKGRHCCSFFRAEGLRVIPDTTAFTLRGIDEPLAKVLLDLRYVKTPWRSWDWRDETLMQIFLCLPHLH